MKFFNGNEFIKPIDCKTNHEKLQKKFQGKNNENGKNKFT